MSDSATSVDNDNFGSLLSLSKNHQLKLVVKKYGVMKIVAVVDEENFVTPLEYGNSIMVIDD